MSSKANIEIVEPRLLAGVVADEVIASIEESISERGTCSVVLCGGKTPGAIYRVLSKPPRVQEVDWANVKIFWGDERFVPHEDTQSNFHLAQETLLDDIGTPGPKVFPIDTSLKSAKDGAKKYSELIRKEFSIDEGEMPKFDIVLLGVGEDGHTASIFPGSEFKRGEGEICYSVKRSEDQFDRITLSADALFGARKVIFIARGENKANIVQRTIEGSDPVEIVPARLYAEVSEVVTWFVDSEAALSLSAT